MPPPPRLPRETSILVVDDSPAIRSRLEAYLRSLGFQDVKAAGTVREALEVFRAQPAEIVFLDLMVDDEKGIDFAAPALAQRPLTDIVLMSALSSDHEQVTAAIAEGAREYLAKPFTFASIESVLQRLANDRLAKERGSSQPSRLEDASYH